MDPIQNNGPIKGLQGLGKPNSQQSPKAGGSASFSDTLKGFMSDVNNMQQKADESIKKMAVGEITDVHQVMSSVEEANVAFNMMMEIRNKVMDAYQEIIRMRL